MLIDNPKSNLKNLETKAWPDSDLQKSYFCYYCANYFQMAEVTSWYKTQ